VLNLSWRWFGPNDRITLEQIIQTGARSIVTALHQVPTGKIWLPDEIRKRKKIIEKSGLEWSVVESVPVHEDIKKHTGNYLEFIENYKQTIVNLGKENIKTICYNFMPALDWSRTNLQYRLKDGTETTCFNYSHFAAIDIYILKRPGAMDSYPDDVLLESEDFFKQLKEDEIEKLKEAFLLGFPGSDKSLTTREVLQRITGYKEITNDDFKLNLYEFLQEIIPVAESMGVNLAIHPDDPPWPLMGLPRIVSTLEDIEGIIKTVNSPSNGVTFCTGSFGAAYSNDLPIMAEKLANRINFAHLRNVSRDDHFNFHEENFFDGDINMYKIMRTIIQEDQKREMNQPDYQGIPIRPDHGLRILGDLEETNYPGYSLYGRMKSLAEIRALGIGIRNGMGNVII